MNITFLGATHEVTGSCTFVEVGNVKFVVDCGMEQGKDMFENQVIPVDGNDVDFVLLTHAHIDHSGNLPLMRKSGFAGKIYATEATCSLAKLMLMDCAHIQETEAEYKNRKGKRAGKQKVEPIYDSRDAEETLELLVPCRYDEVIKICDEVTIRFKDIGHLLGSACIEIWMTENGVTKKMVFSGDVGNLNHPIVKDPAFVDDADYLLIESTYGTRYHQKSDTGHAEALAAMIQRTLDRGGNVVIPCFAVGRTQEMLYFIREIKERGLVKGHDGFRVVVDSPLASEATKVFQTCDEDYLDDETKALVGEGVNPLVFDGLELSIDVEESKALNTDPEPKVILSASGMCDAGRIRHHLKHNLWRPECLIAFVGFQSEGTLGRILYEGAESVKLFGEDIAVKAEIDLLPGTSGHADRDGLIRWLHGFKKMPEVVFVNHGEDDVCTQFAEAVRDEFGVETYAPYSGTEYDLAKGEFVRITDGVPIKKPMGQQQEKYTVKHQSEEYNKLMAAFEELEALLHTARSLSNKELKKYTKSIIKLINDIKS